MSKLKSIITQIKKMKKRDWCALVALALTFLPGKVWKLFSKNIWVVSEYEMLARDNGYWTFKYIRERDPDRKVYYPISKLSPDYEKVEKLGNTIKFGGWKHYLLFWAAELQIGTTKCYGFPYRRICEDLVQWNLHGFKYVFLNHGFTRGYSQIVDAKETNYNLIFTCSKKDRKIIIEDNGQLEQIVRDVGYSRHDMLNNELLNRRQILIMPTWRKWIDYRLLEKEKEKQENLKNYLNSPYFNCYKDLLDDDDFIHFLELNDFTVIFYLHEYAQEYSEFFKPKSRHVIIGRSENYSIQELLKSSVLLITDYSSVCYDFAYMYKPVIYYQFDLEEFETYQYATGEKFSYSEDGFGEVFYTKDKLVDAIKKAYEQDFQMKPIYRKRVNEFFSYHDSNNSRRVYEEIKKISRR